MKKEIAITPAEGALTANSGIEVPVPSERRTSVVLTSVFLPWIAAVLFTAGSWAALNFLAYAIMVFAAGYSIISVTLPAPARSQTIVLAPAVGILAISALTAFWVRLAFHSSGPQLFGSHLRRQERSVSGAIAPVGRTAPSPTA